MSDIRDITVIVGLSGVGKTFVINRLMSEDEKCIHLSAGSLIRKRLANIERDSLRVLNREVILDNQFLMAEQFNSEISEISKDFKILLDAHMMIDNDKELIDIPFSIFQMINPNRLFFLFEEAGTIISRRKIDVTRGRPVRSENEIVDQQDRSLLLATNLCDYLSVPLYKFSSSEVDKMKEVLSFRLRTH